MKSLYQVELLPCPFCKLKKVFIGVHDDEGNYKGRIGCEYEKDPWSGLSYALHHEGWGECILCTDGDDQTMGGVLFDTPKEAAEEWNGGAGSTEPWSKENPHVIVHPVVHQPTKAVDSDPPNCGSSVQKTK